MNTYQFLSEAVADLQALTYAGGEPVFAAESVFVSIAPEDEVYTTYRTPMAILAPLGFRADEEDPRLLDQTIGLRLVTAAQGDERGTNALMGAHRVSAGDSRGAGLLQLEEAVMDVMAKVGEAEGLSIELRAGSAGRARLLGDGRYMAVRDYEFRAYLTSIAT